MYKNPKLVVACLVPKVSVNVDENSEKISPQPKNTMPDITANNAGLPRVASITQTASASIEKAMNMVRSRPILSDTQPKKGRVSPLAMRCSVSAKGSAAMPEIVTSAMPKSRITGANCETTISPPVDIMVIMRNISQKIGVRIICSGV